MSIDNKFNKFLTGASLLVLLGCGNMGGAPSEIVKDTKRYVTIGMQDYGVGEYLGGHNRAPLNDNEGRKYYFQTVSQGSSRKGSTIYHVVTIERASDHKIWKYIAKIDINKKEVIKLSKK